MRWSRIRCASGQVTAAVLLQCSTLHAEPLRLTMDEAVARATNANLELSAGRKDISVARANLDRSSNLLPSNPYVSFGTFGQGLPQQQQATQEPSRSTYTNFYGSVSQEFEIAGQRGKRISVAQQSLAKEEWNVRSTELNLAATVKVAFVRALAQIQRVALSQQDVSVGGEFAKAIAVEKQLSDTDRIDLNTTRIQEARARRTLLANESARDAALDELRRLLDLPIYQEVELSGALRTTPQPLPAVGELIERALEKRPDLQAQKAGGGIVDAQLALLRRERFPNVMLSGSLSYYGESDDKAGGGDIGVALPVFVTKSSDIDEAVAEKDRNHLLVKNLERQIETDVRVSYRNCTIAASDLDAFRLTIIPLSEENARQERQLFERDEVSPSLALAQQLELNSARREYLEAIETYNVALIELSRVVASPVETP